MRENSLAWPKHKANHTMCLQRGFEVRWWTVLPPSGIGGKRLCHEDWAAAQHAWTFRQAHTEAVAACQSLLACTRKVRRVRREIEWRWRLKVL